MSTQHTHTKKCCLFNFLVKKSLVIIELSVVVHVHPRRQSHANGMCSCPLQAIYPYRHCKTVHRLILEHRFVKSFVIICYSIRRCKRIICDVSADVFRGYNEYGARIRVCFVLSIDGVMFQVREHSENSFIVFRREKGVNCCVVMVSHYMCHRVVSLFALLNAVAWFGFWWQEVLSGW